MIPANLLSALQVLSHSGKQSVAMGTEADKTASTFEAGQQLQGSVQAKVSEGLFRVQVAGQSIQMRLPSNVQIGDTVKLEVVTARPRVTFSIIASSNPLSTSEVIGAAARLLSNLAEQPLEQPGIQQLGSKAVWQGELQDTKLLAGALRDELGKSGLFYESHQAQWVRGERSINQLLQEPQNVLTREAADVTQPVPKELMSLVQQQLHTLEQHHLLWMGQVWPGQQMQWQIQGQPERKPKKQDEKQWSTEMELALPKLGDVQARLVFSGNGLRLTLRAADPATIDLFNRSLPRLKHSLAEADIAVSAAVVEKS